MDPKQDRLMRSRGAALTGNLVITGAGGFGNSPRISRPTRKPARWCGKSSFSDTPDVTFTAAPLAIKDKVIVDAANGDQGVRDWIAGLDAYPLSQLYGHFKHQLCGLLPSPRSSGQRVDVLDHALDALLRWPVA
jgi:hypothetical protein